VSQVSEIPGLDTIRGLAGEPPQIIPVNKEVMVKQQHLMHEWNPVFIAVIPFCFKCKEPLVWHTPIDGEVLFHCPKCQRKWINSKVKEGGNKDDNS